MIHKTQTAGLYVPALTAQWRFDSATRVSAAPLVWHAKITLVAKLVALMLLLLVPRVGGAANRSDAASPASAQQLVKQTADQVLKVLDSRHDELVAKPELIYGLVDKIVVPQFDFTRITQYAMGRHWKQTGEDERRAIIAAFRELLVRSYASALLNYSGQQIHVLPVRVSKDSKKITVRTEVTDPDRSVKVPVNYKLYRKSGQWKAYDVVIDGMSLVSNYRSSFDREVRRGGAEGLIQALKEKLHHPSPPPSGRT